MVNKRQSYSKQKLQEELARLGNEIEELRMEREESKKNVLHFMQEADTARQDLQQARKQIVILSSKQTQDPSVDLPSQSIDESLHKQSQEEQIVQLETLLTRATNSLVEHEKTAELHSRDTENIAQLTDQVKQLTDQLKDCQNTLNRLSDSQLLIQEELDQAIDENRVLRQTLKVEHERGERLENHWKTSENALEQAEIKVELLNKELEGLRKQTWESKVAQPDTSKIETLERLQKTLQQKYQDNLEKYSTLEQNLENEVKSHAHLKTQYEDKLKLLTLRQAREDEHNEMLDQSKVREQHLRTINKTLRDEIRKISRNRREVVNVEYLRNVILTFLEKKQTRHQLVPVLSTLLQCSNVDQAHLYSLVRNKAAS
ncbi:hypothetical protein CLU79DRAFT_722006 [Phycomyces nitens]|nr:hypothetical protein CLU79DRAFT_722006 [Phycomyces nitens]